MTTFKFWNRTCGLVLMWTFASYLEIAIKHLDNPVYSKFNLIKILLDLFN